MSETIRAFTAYELSDRDAWVPAYYMDALRAWNIKGIELEGVDNLHITLNFLGDITSEQAEIILQELHDVAQSVRIPIPVVHGMPSGFNPRFLFVSVLPISRVQHLYKHVTRRLAARLNLTLPNARDYTPHITLARLPKGTSEDVFDDVVKALRAYEPPPTHHLPFDLSAISLLKSVRLADGTVRYERVGRVELVAGD